MDANWRVLITTCTQDKDHLEAEVWYGDEKWAALTDSGEVIKFFCRREEAPWAFKIDEVLVILNILSKDPDEVAPDGLAKQSPNLA